MAEGDIGSVLDSLEFEAGTATRPKLLHVHGDVFAVAYTGPDGDGWIATVKVDSAGAIPATIEHSLEFEGGNANDLDFIKVASGVFAVVYRDESNDGDIRTVNISDAGTISLVAGESWEFEAGACYTPCFAKVADNVFAIAYRNASVHGRVVTVGISDGGAISHPLIGELIFDATRCLQPCIVHVTGEVYAIAYQGPDDDGWVTTVNITDGGGITDPAAVAFEFDPTSVGQCRMLQASEGIFVIVYMNADNDGDMVTVSIDAAGAIGDPILDDQEFDAMNANYPAIIPASGEFCAIAYRGTADRGWLRTWAVDAAGLIAGTEQDSLEFDAVHGAFPHILHVAGNIYAIAYATGAVGGKVISIDIETLGPAAADPHFMLMGIG